MLSKTLHISLGSFELLSTLVHEFLILLVTKLQYCLCKHQFAGILFFKKKFVTTISFID